MLILEGVLSSLGEVYNPNIFAVVPQVSVVSDICSLDFFFSYLLLGAMDQKKERR